MMQRDVLDLFSAAAGGWSLGMHRAGFQTMAACEFVDWRRALYQENNPGVRIYDDVRTLTADRILRDCGRLPSVVVGSPPCQDISSANTKGKGVEGERSGLYFEAVRIIGECRPRWFALENSSNLRTRGADAVLAALEALGYACWSFVVRAGDIGANHERPRCWLVGCDVSQVTDASFAVAERRDAMGGRSRWPEGLERDRFDGRHLRTDEATRADGNGRDEGREGRRRGLNISIPDDSSAAPGFRHESGRSWGHGPDGDGSPSVAGRNDAGDASHADQAGQADGCMVSGVRQAEISDDGRGSGRSDDGSGAGQMGLRSPDRRYAPSQRANWSLDDLANHLRLDDGLSPWVAGTRIAVGGPKGTSAASLIVEAFGDAVIPQIPEAIGRAILRTEAALAAIYGQQAA